MSPQRSNRAQLIEGTLRCLERLAPERITARAIADESGANLASITYHFGSKDNLVTEAVIEGLDRWLADIAHRLAEVASASPTDRILRAAKIIEESRQHRAGLARNFIGALAKAQHDDRVRQLLTEGFRKSRAEVAAVVGLGSDRVGTDAGALVLALFNGLLFQTLLDHDLALEGPRIRRALGRLREVLPEP